MLKRVRHLIAFAWLAAALFGVAGVHAASLEKIEVASRLGEPFYAEVPLKLEADESVSRIFVEIAAPADYKIFEVYREPVLNSIRADVASDQRGVRVELSSRTAISAPFINLVLKIRYGRVAHFKKFAVFLEPPKTTQAAAQKAPLPTVTASENAAKPVIESVVVTETEPLVEETNADDDWARTDQYGPIVRGDALSTVAQRLRKDRRYKPYRVMVALFEKNKSKFEHENMNLLRAGSFLEVPSAAEIEQRTAKEAYQLYAEHEKQWKSLTSTQPRFAVEAEAQKNRYSKRVSIGNQAGGSTAAPVVAQLAPASVESSEPAVVAAGKQESADNRAVTPIEPENEASIDEGSSLQVAQLKAENEALQQQLLENRQSIAALSNKMDEVTSAASRARIEKLEVLLTRLQAELEKSSHQTQPMQRGSDWLVWVLVVLVLILLGFIAVLMRREPKHPAESEVAAEAESGGAAVAAATVAAVAAVEAQGDKKEPDVFDSISSFADDLTDTDTAEMEPFDATALEEDPDPNVDYISEADVYIRYGMNDEALHQLDMALRLDPAHAAAHIRKATLLHGTGDQAAYQQAISEAALVLDADELEKLKSPGDEHAAAQLEDKQQSEAVATTPDQDVEPVHLQESPVADDGINFDLSDIDVPDQPERSADDDGGMDWLHDDSFDDSVGADQDLLSASDGGSDVPGAGAGATQMFDNLLDEFADDQTEKDMSEEAAVDNESTQQLELDETLELASAGATQDLDHLLSEFSEQDELEDAAASATNQSESTLVLDENMAETQHLDRLLGEFSDDDKMFDFGTETDELDAAVFKQADAAVARDQLDGGSEFGATQHLDVLMSEFAEDGAKENSQTPDQDALDVDHGATQELDHLLTEFAAADDYEAAAAVASDPLDDVEMDHGATQELDHLLTEFSAEEDGSEAAGEDDGAIEELGPLLSEFSGADEETFEPDWLSEDFDDSGSNSEHGATQKLDQLLGEFSDDDKEDGKHKG